MTWGNRWRAWRRGRAERGAVAVEVILLTPVFLGLFLGMVEVALLFRDAMAVTALSRSGARVAAAEPRFGTATSPYAHDGSINVPATGTDPARIGSFAWDAAQAVQTSSDTIQPDAIQAIRVYQDDGSGPPATCAPATCVEYGWDDGADAIIYRSGAWSPASIRACLEDSSGTNVGVYVEARHDWVMGFFGGGSGTVTGNTVMRFEPLQPDHDAPGVRPGCQP